MAEIAQYIQAERRNLAEQVRRIIQRGGIVAVPTETYYGLGVNPFDAHAVDRLLRVKGRVDGKPILVVIGQRTQLFSVVLTISPAAAMMMEAFWPGPLTILFAAHPSLLPTLTAGTGTIGVRLSSCGPLAALLEHVGPLTGTSANRAGCAPVQTAHEVQQSLGQDIDLIVDAGTTPGGLPSTVVDARETVRLIREGAVTRQMLENVLQTRGMSLT